MSIYTDAYKYFSSDNLPAGGSCNQTDPTETVVEWLAEMKFGQLEAFTYSHSNTESKNVVKALSISVKSDWHILALKIFKKECKLSYEKFDSDTRSSVLEILSPPPDSAV